MNNKHDAPEREIALTSIGGVADSVAEANPSKTEGNGPALQARVEKADASSRCDHCGSPLEVGDVFCPECGSKTAPTTVDGKLPIPPPVAPTSPLSAIRMESDSRGGWIGWSLVAAVVVIGIIGLISIINAGKRQDEQHQAAVMARRAVSMMPAAPTVAPQVSPTRPISQARVLPSQQTQFVACYNCGGNGRCPWCGSNLALALNRGKLGLCSSCHGTGKESTRNEFGIFPECGLCRGTGRCHACQGIGKCEVCNGSGQITLAESVAHQQAEAQMNQYLEQHRNDPIGNLPSYLPPVNDGQDPWLQTQ